MANRDFKKIKRVMKDFSQNVGSGSGGAISVDKLPEKGNVGEFYSLPNGEIYTFMHQEKQVPIYKETFEAGDVVEFLYKTKDLDKNEIWDTIDAIRSWMPKAGSIILNEVPTIASGNQLVGYVQSTHNGPFDIVVASNTGEEIGKASYDETNNIEMVSVEGDLAIPLTITLTQEIINKFTELDVLHFLTDLLDKPIIGYETVITEWWQKTNGAIVIDMTKSDHKTIYLNDPDYDALSIYNSVLNGGDVRVIGKKHNQEQNHILPMYDVSYEEDHMEMVFSNNDLWDTVEIKLINGPEPLFFEVEDSAASQITLYKWYINDVLVEDFPFGDKILDKLKPTDIIKAEISMQSHTQLTAFLNGETIYSGEYITQAHTETFEFSITENSVLELSILN